MSHVLIVEDDHAMQQIFAEVLKLDGHKTRTAGDGEKAIQLLNSQQPDILIMDMNLPKISGYELLDFVHASGMAPAMKIIIVTANNAIQNSREADLVDQVLLKPVSMPQLRSMVGQLTAT